MLIDLCHRLFAILSVMLILKKKNISLIKLIVHIHNSLPFILTLLHL